MSISEFKKVARTKLNGNYFLCICSSLLYFITLFALSYVESRIINIINNNTVTLLISFVFALISLILGYGIIANILELSDIKTNSITNFLNISIKNTTKIIKLKLSIILKLIIPTIIFMFSSVYTYFSYFDNLIPMFMFSLIICIISLIFIIYIYLKYALTSYIYYSNSSLTSREIMKKSAEIMKGNKIKFILLILSFFNWLLIASIILYILGKFIPRPYLTPFIIIFHSLIKPYIVNCISIFYDENNN